MKHENALNTPITVGGVVRIDGMLFITSSVGYLIPRSMLHRYTMTPVTLGIQHWTLLKPKRISFKQLLHFSKVKATLLQKKTKTS